jgi:hypothetical protein
MSKRILVIEDRPSRCAMRHTITSNRNSPNFMYGLIPILF